MGFDIRAHANADRFGAAAKQEELDTFLTIELTKSLKMSKISRDKWWGSAKSVGKRRPNATIFRETFPNFPIYIGCRRKLALRDNSGLKMLFPLERMLKKNFVVQFRDMLEEEEAEIGGRASALLIAWPGRMCVALHNLPIPKREPRVCFYINDGDKLRLTLEPVEHFVQLLADHADESQW